MAVSHAASNLCKYVQHGGIDFVSSLINKDGADVNAKDLAGNAPIHHAVMQGMVSMVKLLLDNHADINITNIIGMSAIMIAVDYGHDEIVKVLCAKKARLDNQHYDIGDSIIHRASWNGHCAIVKILLEEGLNPRIKWDALDSLHAASHEGWPDVVEFLLESKAVAVNSQSDTLLTSLHIASIRGHLDVAKVLIKFGASIEAYDNDRNTALHHAIMHGHPDVVKFLLESGANANTPNRFLDTMIHSSVLLRDSSVLDLLCKHGVDIETRGEMTHETPLIFAAKLGNEVALLYLIQKNANVNAQDANGNTALHYSIAFQNPWSVKALLESSASIYLQNSHKHSALFNLRAAVMGYSKEVPWVGLTPKMNERSSISDTVILMENFHAKCILAFAMGLHERLGLGTAVSSLDTEIVKLATSYLCTKDEDE